MSAARCVRSSCFRQPKGALILPGYSGFRTRESPKPATPYNNALFQCNLPVRLPCKLRRVAIRGFWRRDWIPAKRKVRVKMSTS